MKSNKKHLYQLIFLNIGMLFISSSGVLGRYITLPPPLSIWLRSLIAIVLLTVYAYIKKFSFKIDWKSDFKSIFWSGFFLTLHWVSYFFSLQWSNVAIGMLSLFTYPIITVFLEPLFMPVTIQKRHFFLGLLIILGVFFLVPVFNFKNSLTQGLLMGLFSAFCYSIRNLISKKYNTIDNATIKMIFQLLIVIIILFPLMPNYSIMDAKLEWPFLLVLGIITTAIGHTLFLNSFSYFNISTASIMSSIQPIFGVFLGALFLFEVPSIKNIFGGFLILITVIIESRQFNKNK